MKRGARDRWAGAAAPGIGRLRTDPAATREGFDIAFVDVEYEPGSCS